MDEEMKRRSGNISVFGPTGFDINLANMAFTMLSGITTNVTLPKITKVMDEYDEELERRLISNVVVDPFKTWRLKMDKDEVTEATGQAEDPQE